MLSLLEALFGDAWIADCETLDMTTGEDLPDLPDALALGHAQMAGVFPNAQILQVNYPRFLPAPEFFPGDTCSWIDRRDASYARGIADELNGIIATQIAAANATHGPLADGRDRFVLVDVSELFGSNPLCPQEQADQYFVSVPSGAPLRVAERIFDPDQEPGQYLAAAASNESLALCAANAVVFVLDCPSDDLVRQFGAWFPEHAAEVLPSHLAHVDESSFPLEIRDDVALENFRNLFHPNAAGFEVIACAVLATYQELPTSTCTVPDQPAPEGLSFNGLAEPLIPITADVGDVLSFVFPGFAAGSVVDVVLRSTPVDLGSYTAGPDGRLNVDLILPDGVTPGVHRIVARGEAPSGVEVAHTVFVEVGGNPQLGSVVGVHQVGYEPFESVVIGYLGDDDFRTVFADDRGVVFAEIPLPLSALGQDLTVTLTDESGTSAQQPIEATEPEPPVAEADVASVETSESISVDVLANDTDPDDNLDESSLAIAVDPAIGTAAVVDVDGTPEILFTAGDTGGVATIGYVVCDDTGLCANGELTITVVAAEDCTIIGTEGDDVLVGTEGDDVICGLGGDDTITGGAGDDLILGGAGADEIGGGDGHDTIMGGAGADEIGGGDGADLIRGNRGADVIRGNRGADELHGGRGADDIHGGRGADLLFGGAEADTLRGDRGDDVLRGRRGADTLLGGDDNDMLFGGRGNDTLDGQSGNDTLRGRRGDDTLIGGPGTDTGRGGRGTDTCTCTSLETAAGCEN